MSNTLAFPIWVLVVSLLVLIRAGVIDFHHDNHEGDRGERSPADR